MKERGRNGGKMARREEERKEGGKNEEEMEGERRERNRNDLYLWIKL